MGRPERLSEAEATRVITLPGSLILDEWRAWVDTARGEHPPMDWFLALAALSDPSADLEYRQPVVIEHLGRALGASRSKPVSDGAIHRHFDMLLDAFGAEALEGVVIAGSPDDASSRGRAILGLYHQARMATFLPYRDGLERYLREVPISPEGALHAYVRVVTDWAHEWPGLAVATRAEYADALALRDPDGPTMTQVDFLRARSALPLVVGWDLRAILRLVKVEAGDIDSSLTPASQIGLAVDAIILQLALAIAMMARDPSLEALSAANVARIDANNALGGALGRLRARGPGTNIVTRDVLEQVRRYFLEPSADDPSPAEVEERARLANKFHLLRIAVGALGSQNAESER